MLTRTAANLPVLGATATAHRLPSNIYMPIASGWSGLPGGACTHWKAPAFARRTPEAAVQPNFELCLNSYPPFHCASLNHYDAMS